MKRKQIVCISVAAMIIMTVIAGWVCLTQTPLYAMKRISKDIDEYGIEGLYTHLTGDAKKTVDMISAIPNNSWMDAVMGVLVEKDYMSTLTNEIQTVKWDMVNISRNGDQAEAVLSFDYKDKLIGTIEINMVRKNGEWLINSFDIPKIKKIDLK